MKLKLNEGYGSDDKYMVHIKPDLQYYGLTYRGWDIDEITLYDDIVVEFIIELDIKEWGIRGISIYDFKGPNSIRCEVMHYIGDELKGAIIDLSLDWTKCKHEVTNQGGSITIEEVIIELANTNASSWTSNLMNLSSIVVKEITVETSW